MSIPHIQKYTEIFKTEYPTAEEITNTQLTKYFWTADEIKVENDVQDILVNCTEAERHGVLSVLKLFTLYELKAGADYWTGRFMTSFKRHELQAMAAAFGMMELCVHKPFYNKINELLNVDNSFYSDYQENQILRSRMEFIDKAIDHPNDLVSLGVFSMVEGVILYSSFAFLKHFQSQGKNKLKNICAGINFSVRDEALHAEAGAWAYRKLSEQAQRSHGSILSILEAADIIYMHESEICKMIFEKGDIPGITYYDLLQFIGHRLNICLTNLGIEQSKYKDIGTIKDWFYAGINKFKFPDFFDRQGNEYTRDWNQQEFRW